MSVDSYNNFRELCLSTKFQQSRHISKTDDEEIQSMHWDTFKKATWSLKIPIKMSSEISSVDEKNKTRTLVFRSAGTALYHGLTETYLALTLPAINLRDGFQGRWCRNPVINSIIKAKMIHNGVQLAQLESKYLDHHLQTLTDGDHSDQEVGNIPALQTWSQNLPEHKGSLSLPWFYSYRRTSYFPMYLCYSMDRLEHHFVLRTSLSDLLDIRAGEDLVPFDPDRQLALSVAMPTPDLFGEYLFMTDKEVDTYRCINTHKENMYTDVIRIDDPESENTVRPGDATTIPITTSYPIHCLFWGFSNGRNLSNYTISNTYDLGESPIEWSTLKHGSMVIFDKLEAWQTESHYPGKRLLRGPRAPGYSSFQFSDRYQDPDTKPGIILKGGTLTVKVKSTPDDSSKYSIHVYAIVSKCYSFIQAAANEMERTTDAKLSKIVISGDT